MKLPTILSLLAPNQYMAYKSACWLISNDLKDRRTGRTTVISAALLREAMSGRSCQLWDHHHKYGPLETVSQSLGCLARQLGVQVELKHGAIKTIKPYDVSEYRFYAGTDNELSKHAMIDAIKTAYKTGLSKEEILAIVEQSINEEAVEFVHTS